MRPDVAVVFEDGDREIVFRAEVPVQGRLGDARLGDDPVDTNRLQSVALEQPVRGLKDAFASAPGPWSRPASSIRPRSSRLATEASAETPRMRVISGRPTGCR